MEKNIIKLKDINPDLIEFSELKKHQTVKGLKMAFIKYTKKNLVAQFPNVILSCHGFPKQDQYHTQEQRDYIRLPIAPESIMYVKLADLDVKFKELFPKLEYSPLVKYPKNGLPYVKVKLALSYPEKEIDTLVSLNGDHVDIGNVDDFARVVRLKSDVKCMIKFTKLWNINNKYGVTLTLIKIDCVHSESDADVDENENECKWLDESDDDDDQ